MIPEPSQQNNEVSITSREPLAAAMAKLRPKARFKMVNKIAAVFILFLLGLR